jgi:SAM-dependent methyltransferase
MASLAELIARSVPPLPWAEGDNIPWHEPGFSSRMLAEHLSQEHDLASRRLPQIDRQVAYFHASVLAGRPGRVLDLACGPGLYLNRLGGLGHRGRGIDFSPASIEHAIATRPSLAVEYDEADIRTADFGSGYDLVLLLYGQFNVFPRRTAAAILRRAFDALLPGGSIVVEPQTYAHVERTGKRPRSWSAHVAGLFSAEPHLLLNESFWDERLRTATERFHVVDAAGGDVTSYAMSNEAYPEAEIRDALVAAGFDDVATVDSRSGLGGNGLLVATGLRRA